MSNATTNRAAINDLKDSLYASRTIAAIRSQIAFERTEAKRYAKAGKPAMVDACHRAVSDLERRLCAGA